MAESSYPIAQTPMTETQWAQLLGLFYHGVDEGLVVTADGSTMGVTVAPGKAGVKGSAFNSTSIINVPIEASNAADRIDLVVLRRTLTRTPITSSIVEVAVRTGIPGAGKPTPVQDLTGVWEYVLAEATVLVDSVVVTAANVTNVSKSVISELSSDLELTASNIPNIPASRITSGVLGEARIPDLRASKIVSGVFDAARIPSLDATKIVTGTLSVERIPNLSASKITSGILNADRIPSIPAYKITDQGSIAASWNSLVNKPTTFVPAPHNHTAAEVTSGTFNIARIPAIPLASKVSGALPIANGGTGATAAATARINLGLKTGATRNISHGTATPSGGVNGDIFLKVL